MTIIKLVSAFYLSFSVQSAEKERKIQKIGGVKDEIISKN